MSTGWIKLHRKILKWEWFDDDKTFKLFMFLLLSANHADKKWQGVTIKRGQFVTGRKQLSSITGISEQSIRTSIKRLKSTNEITIKSTSQYSIITICNYNDYQGVDQPESTSKSTNNLTSSQPATNQQLTTNKNVKKDKNVKKEEVAAEPPAATFSFLKYFKLSQRSIDDLIKIHCDGDKNYFEVQSLEMAQYYASKGKKPSSPKKDLAKWIKRSQDEYGQIPGIPESDKKTNEHGRVAIDYLPQVKKMFDETIKADPETAKKFFAEAKTNLKIIGK